MSKINWVEVIESNREELIQAISETFKQATCGNVDLEYRVSIDKYGKISKYYQIPGHTPATEWEGEAVCVYGVKGWWPDIEWSEYFTENGIFSDQAEDVLKKYKEAHETSLVYDVYSVENISDIFDGDLADLLEKHMPELYSDIMDNEIDYHTSEFDADSEIDEAAKWYQIDIDAANNN